MTTVRPARPAAWSPEQYLRFEDHRLRPATDLIARIPIEAPARVWDLGAGTGNVTALLRERWPAAEIAGLDASPAMLAKARAVPTIRWQQGDIDTWRAEPPADLVFSNAALQWLPDHDRLMPRLLAQLSPGGVLAVQMPHNGAAPSHAGIVDLARSPRWRDALAAPLAAMSATAEPAQYYRWLVEGAVALDIWESEYLQVLHGEDAVPAFTGGSVLRPFLDALAPEEGRAFLDAYRERMRLAYPRQADGSTLFPFRRLFIVARAR